MADSSESTKSKFIEVIASKFPKFTRGQGFTLAVMAVVAVGFGLSMYFLKTEDTPDRTVVNIQTPTTIRELPAVAPMPNQAPPVSPSQSIVGSSDNIQIGLISGGNITVNQAEKDPLKRMSLKELKAKVDECMSSTTGKTANFVEGVRYLEEAVSRGDLESLAFKAVMMLNGVGYRRNEKEGVYLLEQCVLQGYPTAAKSLGNYYYRQQYSDIRHHALHWYIIAAENSVPGAEEMVRSTWHEDTLIYLQIDYPKDHPKYLAILNQK